MNDSNSPPILEVLITSRDATQAAEKPDDHKQLANQFGLKSPATQLAESHTWSLNGSHLSERKQKVLASHTTLITAMMPRITTILITCWGLGPAQKANRLLIVENILAH